MKIITRAVLDWDGNVLEEESYDYDGPVSSADPGIAAAGIGAAGSILGGNNDSEVTQTSEPWGPAQSYLKNILSEGERLYNKGAQDYPGPTFAPMNPWQLGGLEQQYNYSQGLMPNQVGMAQGAWGSALNAPDVVNNPYVMNQVMANTGLLNRNLSENLLPMIQDNATQAGQSGSSRQGVAEGIALRGTQEAAARQAAATMNQAYGQGLNARQGAMGMSPQMLGLGMLPGMQQSTFGNALNAEAQKYINEAMTRHQYDQDMPWDLLQRYQNVANPIAGRGSVNTSPNVFQQNPFLSGIGGAMMGYDLGNTLFGSTPSTGGTYGSWTGYTNPVTGYGAG
jgi:hypothetical protein